MKNTRLAIDRCAEKRARLEKVDHQAILDRDRLKRNRLLLPVHQYFPIYDDLKEYNGYVELIDI